MEIEDNHPLRKRVKYEHILPCCTRCCKPFGFCKTPQTKRDVSKNHIPLNDFKMAFIENYSKLNKDQKSSDLLVSDLVKSSFRKIIKNSIQKKPEIEVHLIRS